LITISEGLLCTASFGDAKDDITGTERDGKLHCGSLTADGGEPSPRVGELSTVLYFIGLAGGDL